MAVKMPSRSLKKECAAILESMKVSSSNYKKLKYFFRLEFVLELVQYISVEDLNIIIIVHYESSENVYIYLLIYNVIFT